MKNLLLLVCICLVSTMQSQDKAIVQWINNNAIVIEDANPDTKLTGFDKHAPPDFKAARVFGFGEASHHGKEFFDLKAKFFKYLVEDQGVRLFLMEESYQAERGINDYITGGEGDAKAALKNFGMAIWRCNEVEGLLQWMREYNQGKPKQEQIRFYGIDNQFGHDINNRLRTYLKKHKIEISESDLAVADSASAAQLKAGGNKGWDKRVMPGLKKIRQLLEQEKVRLAGDAEYPDIMRGLRYLEQYTAHITAPYSQHRDRDMYNNTLDILAMEGPTSKAFIWAHNEHINKNDLYATSMESLGSRLKKHFKSEYYAMGFDFGSGRMKGYRFENGKNLGSLINPLSEPYKDTYAYTLADAEAPIFFMNINDAMLNPVAKKFFGKKNRHLFLGGPGFDPEKPHFMKRKYSEAYDGLIFVNIISPATY
ncbi:MAG: erythromycin esterase family protein [Flavobacterium sp.]|nr:MAG: erythromycin esterase family protein [Flavobacterium sp.]